jgi:hypothetical protein
LALLVLQAPLLVPLLAPLLVLLLALLLVLLLALLLRALLLRALVGALAILGEVVHSIVPCNECVSCSHFFVVLVSYAADQFCIRHLCCCFADFGAAM